MNQLILRLGIAITSFSLLPIQSYGGFHTDLPLVAELGASQFRQNDWIQSIAVSPSGKRFASGGGGEIQRDYAIYVREHPDGKAIRTFQGHTGYVHGLAFVKEDTIISCSSDSTIRRWRMASPDTSEVLYRDKGRFALLCMALSPSSDRVLLGTVQGYLIDLNLNTNKVVRKVAADGHIKCIAFSPCGSMYAIGGVGSEVKIFESKSGNLIEILKERFVRVTSIAFSPDSKRLLTCSDDKKIRMWALGGSGPKAILGRVW